MSRLALGTAQFGLDYGINNKTGKVSEPAVALILAEAAKNGIECLDTAAAYGDSEDVIGNISTGRYEFKIVTKLSGVSGGRLKAKLLESLARLRMKNVYACLFHSFEEYSAHVDLLKELSDCRDEGLVEKIGFSLYYPEEAKTLLSSGVNLGVIQIPFNILDQRFAELLPEFRKRNIEIHVRSVFLQGLLLKEIGELDVFFEEARPVLTRLRQLARTLGIPVHSLCLNFVAQNELIDKVVVGIDSLAQLRMNMDLVEQGGGVSTVAAELKGFKLDNENILLPSRWR